MFAGEYFCPSPVRLLQQQSVLLPSHSGYWLSLDMAGDLKQCFKLNNYQIV